MTEHPVHDEGDADHVASPPGWKGAGTEWPSGGRKPNTAPRPPRIPSTTRPVTILPAPRLLSAQQPPLNNATTKESLAQSVPMVPRVVTEI